MAKTTTSSMKLSEAVAAGYQLAQRKQGVSRAELITTLDGGIGWKKYLDTKGRADGLKVQTDYSHGDSVVYRMVKGRAPKPAAASRMTKSARKTTKR